MGLLDDTAIFAAIIQQGGFSRAAKHLGLSNGLISRRIAQMETNLGVTLIKRTTRQLKLTPEGELFWQHAQRIQHELNSAVMLVQSSVQKPKGVIRITAPSYFGRHYLTPILAKFMGNFPEIHIELVLSDDRLNPIKEQLDIVIRGAGFIDNANLQDSSLQMRLLCKEKIGLYASPTYLAHTKLIKVPADLVDHQLIHYSDTSAVKKQEIWNYVSQTGKQGEVGLKAQFNCNDIESGLRACIDGAGIGKFTELNVKQALQQQLIRPILTDYEWGEYHLYALFPQQQDLPKRTRLLLDFIVAQTSHYESKV